MSTGVTDLRDTQISAHWAIACASIQEFARKYDTMTQICHAVYMNNVNQSAKRSAVTGDIPLYQDETPTPFYLSDLEFDILLGLACQETPDDIASALKMSVETITSMKLRLRAKLKAMSNTQAVERACYLGLI